MPRATPIVREYLAERMTPLAAFDRLATLSPVRFLLESVVGGEQVSRFSFLGADPRALYRLHPDRLEVESDAIRKTLPGAPLEALRAVVDGWESAASPVPFTGGFVGSFGFDLVRAIERLPAAKPDPLEFPVAVFARFDEVVVFDHARQRLLLAGNAIEGEVTPAAARARLDRLEAALAGAETAAPVRLPWPPAALGRPLRASLAGPEFERAVECAKERIAAGDIFQVVLARRFSLDSTATPVALYRALRAVNPSPYMVLLDFPEGALVGASPEMLVRKTGGRVVTRPIAGTRPRGATVEEDSRFALDLAADPKERAEHVMLVDLGRNDLGRVAAAGTVRVPSFLEVERYSHVMHLVSSVEAEIAPGMTALDAFLAAFPAGTVSGAPKIRAIEILSELEPEGRGPYAGACGYFSFSGDLDTCITIRTLVARKGEVSISAGAGIVADSIPALERQETENKAAALVSAVALAEEIERGAPA